MKFTATVQIFEKANIGTFTFDNSTSEFLAWLISENSGGITIWFN